MKGQIEHEHNKGHRRGADKQEAMFRFLHFLKLAAPFRAIGWREEIGRARLGFGDGAGQVAAAHAELDGDQAIALLA